ncbi:ArsR/SmtB family transcription factor [Ferroacidibacillus organovorans]|uniref:ArsR/SmtB family transcription factor n=1 Tax=Ferroacidibacillus organovorans TaxID=1765683 RepID=UPI0026977AC0
MSKLINLNAESCCGGSGAHLNAVEPCASSALADDTVKQLSEWFKALSDPTRIRILSILAQRELCVCDLAEALGMTQSAISHQLRYLHLATREESPRRKHHLLYARRCAHVGAATNGDRSRRSSTKGEFS